MEKIGKFRFIAAIAVAVMLMLVLSACGGDSAPASTATPQPTPTQPPPSPTVAPKSNADLLKEAAATMKAAKSYHMLVTGTQGGQEFKIDGDIDLGNNKSKLVLTATGQTANVISIGSDTYVSIDGGTTYAKSPAGTDMGISNFTKLWDGFKPEDIDKAKDAIKDGNPKDETIGGDATHHMMGTTKELASLSPNGGNGTTDGTVDMWVTTESSTPTMRKMQIQGTANGANVDATLEWTKVNENFTIEAPDVTVPTP